MSVAPHRNFWVPIIGILLPLILGMASPDRLEEARISIGGKSFLVELAQTPAQRRQGLMQRRQLADDRGMLLVYSQDGNHRIWMKNMLIPLQVYWIDADFRVIHNLRLEPCRVSPCPSYGAPSASRYVLELNDSTHAIQPGDRVNGLNALR